MPLPSLNRFILYVALATGYLLSAILLSLFIYQRISLGNSNNSATLPSSKNNAETAIGLDRFDKTDSPPIYNKGVKPLTTTVRLVYGQSWSPRKPDFDFASAYPVEKVEIRLSSSPTSPSSLSSALATIRQQLSNKRFSTAKRKWDSEVIIGRTKTNSPLALTTATTLTIAKISTTETSTSHKGTSATIVINNAAKTDTTTTAMGTSSAKAIIATVLTPPSNTTPATFSKEASSSLVAITGSGNENSDTTASDEQIAVSGSGAGGEICETDECILVASDIIRSMNRQADPCTNFYEFTCGRYGQAPGFMGNYHDRVAAVHRFPSEIELTYKFLVENTLDRRSSSGRESTNHSDDRYLRKVRRFYRSCMHQSSFNKYMSDLKTFLFGVSSIAVRSTDLTRIVGELLLRDVFPLFGFAVHRPPLGDGHQKVDGRLALTAPTRHLHPFTLQPSATRSSTLVKIESMAELLSDELSAAFGIHRSVIKAIDTEMEKSRLRNLYSFVQRNRDCERTVYVDTLTSELGNFSHLFDWKGVVRFLTERKNTPTSLSSSSAKSLSHQQVGSICVSEEFRRYLVSIEPIFANVSKMELLFYSAFKAGQHLVNYWNVFEEHGNSFSRQAECYKLVKENFRDFVAQIVRKSLVYPGVERMASHMASQISKLSPTFSSINLSETLEAEMLQVRSSVPKMWSDEQLEEIHKSIPKMNANSFLPNVLSAWKFKNLRLLRKVGAKRIDLVQELDLILSLKAQAAFVPTLRQIRIYPLLLALLSPDIGFTGESLPHSFSYGTLGFAIAHEYAHALQFYQEHEARQNDKITVVFETIEQNRKICLNKRNADVFREKLNQLSLKSLVESGMAEVRYRADGEFEQFDEMSASASYLNELWADVLGLRLSYAAFQQRSLSSKQRLLHQGLPGLSNLTASQLFFVSFAQVFCSKSSPKIGNMLSRQRVPRSIANEFDDSNSYYSRNRYAHLFLRQNQRSHPPNYVRATLPILLFKKEFGAAFSCPALSVNLSSSDNCD